jgi:hypothetical protein
LDRTAAERDTVIARHVLDGRSCSLATMTLRSTSMSALRFVSTSRINCCVRLSSESRQEEHLARQLLRVS